MDLQRASQASVACAACQIAAARIMATLASELFFSATYWFDEEKMQTHAPTLIVARQVLLRSSKVREKKQIPPHICGGKPARCKICGVPSVQPDECLNLLCGKIAADERLRMLGPLKPQDAVTDTDFALLEADVPGQHYMCEVSLWPNTLWVGLDGDLFRTSPMFPTQLSDEEIFKLPSKDAKYLQVNDLELGITHDRPLTAFNGETYREVGISWWGAYQKASTGERFRVYECDHE